jgi:hypothetical protein
MSTYDVIRADGVEAELQGSGTFAAIDILNGHAVVVEEVTSGFTGPVGPAGKDGADGQATIIVGEFLTRLPADLPDDGIIPEDWDGTGTFPGGLTVAVGESLINNNDTTGDDFGDLFTFTGTGWVNVGLVRGPEGAVGQQGDKGDQGEKGDQGDAGHDGTDGAIGPTGPAGADGADGIDGQATIIVGEFLTHTPSQLPDDGLIPSGWEPQFTTEMQLKVGESLINNNETDADFGDLFQFVGQANGGWVNVGLVRGPQGVPGKDGAAASVPGGLTGMPLVKKSNADGDMGWAGDGFDGLVKIPYRGAYAFTDGSGMYWRGATGAEATQALVLRQGAGGVQPRISNNNGTSERDIIDATNLNTKGDTRWLKKSGDTMNAGGRLSFQNEVGEKIALWGTGANQFGLGIAAGDFQCYVSDTTNKFSFRTGGLSGAEVAKIDQNGVTLLQDGDGVWMNGGGGIYKKVGGGVTIRQHSNNVQPTIENFDGSNRRNILDAYGGTLAGNLTFSGTNLGITFTGGSGIYSWTDKALTLREGTNGSQPRIINNDGGGARDIIDTTNGDARYMRTGAAATRSTVNYVNGFGGTMEFYVNATTVTMRMNSQTRNAATNANAQTKMCDLPAGVPAPPGSAASGWRTTTRARNAAFTADYQELVIHVDSTSVYLIVKGTQMGSGTFWDATMSWPVA